MKNPEIGTFNTEPTEQPPVDLREVLSRLARLNHELGWGLEEDAIEDLKGADDNDLLGNLATLALEHGIDPDDFFYVLGIEMERAVENEADTE